MHYLSYGEDLGEYETTDVLCWKANEQEGERHELYVDIFLGVLKVASALLCIYGLVQFVKFSWYH